MNTRGARSRVFDPYFRAPALVLTLALAVAISACTAEVGEIGAHANPIVNGTNEPGRPEVVYMFRLDGASCTGTLIAPRVVLTARHCVDRGTAAGYRIYVGSSLRNVTAQYAVSEIFRTPEGTDNDGSDIGLLVLSTAANETPMEISRERPELLFGEPVTSVGFGLTPSGESGTKYTTTTSIDGFEGGYIFVRPSVCSGDSGGPLIGPDGRLWGVASFIYSEDGLTEPSCGTAPGAYNEIFRWLELIDMVVESTGTCVPRGAETCNGVDDNCDGAVDEICTPLGQSCTVGSQCVGGTCGDTVIGRICTTPCDPLRPAQGCSPGAYCTGGGSCTGFCIPGTAGTVPNDSDCSADTDCASLFCDDPGDGRRRCLDPCRGDAGVCLAGEVCAAPAGSCGGCVPRELVGSPRGLGEPCGSDAECRGELICHPYAGTNECASSCVASDDECGEGFECRERLCIRDRRQGVGGPCVDSADCGGGTCAHQGERNWCTITCTADASCPVGFSCQLGATVRVCSPNRSLIGEACVDGPECTTDLCAGIGGQHVCTTFCDGQTACGAGFECVRVDDGTNVAVCLRAGTATGGCAVTAGPVRAGFSGWISLLVLGLFVARRSFRRAR